MSSVVPGGKGETRSSAIESSCEDISIEPVLGAGDATERADDSEGITLMSSALRVAASLNRVLRRLRRMGSLIILFGFFSDSVMASDVTAGSELFSGSAMSGGSVNQVEAD